MSSPFYYNDNTESSHRVCQEINLWHTFNIPPPSPKRRSSIENEEIPVLTLESFQRPPLLNFGKVTVSSNVTKSFNIYNPVDDEQEVRIFKLPKPEFGFVIDNSPIIVEGGQIKTVDVRWKPDKPGNARVKVHFTTSYNEKFELTIIGMAQEPAKTVTKRRAKPRRNRKPTGKVELINPSIKEELPLVATDIIDKNKLMKNEAAIVIQKNFRRCIARKEFLRQRTAALIIQRYWLRYYTKKLNNRRATFIKGKRSLVTSVCLENEVKKMEAAIVIQKYFRGFITRKNFLKQVVAAKTIQRHWRQHNIQKLADSNAESKKLASAVIIQKNIRCFIARQRFLKQVFAAKTIQRHWRQHYIKKLMESELRKYASAIIIQTNFRCFIARRDFVKKVAASKTVQRYWRQHVIQKLMNSENESRRVAAAIVIQKNFRRFIARENFLKKVMAAKTIQRLWRLHYNKKRVGLDNISRMASAIIIQKNIRCFIARRRFLGRVVASKTIQRCWRRYVMRKLMENESKQLHSAIIIQKHFRRFIAHKNFLKQIIAARTIQRCWRRHVVRNNAKKVASAIVIQKYFRTFIARKKFLQKVTAVATIQRRWRKYYKKLNDSENGSKKLASALIIQKNIRCFIARKKFLKQVAAAKTIQSHWRQHYFQTLSHNQSRKVAAAIMIQKHFRRFIARKNFLKQLLAARTIQRCWRRLVIRNNAKKVASAIVIQKNIRRLIARRNYVKKVLASKTIQRCWRQHVMRKLMGDEFRKEASAVVLQKNFRSFIARKNFLKKQIAARIVQKCWRKLFIRKLMEDGSRKQASAIIIQKNYRRYLARKNFLKQKTAAETIQRWWRRLLNRGKCPQKTSVLEKDISLNVANLSVAECLKVSDTSALPIGCRTDLAFKKLIHYRKFCQLQTALSSLDTTTKISPESCIKISSPTAVNTIINIIKQSNRSEPSKFVIADAFSILLTLVKYDKTQDLIINRPSIIYLCIEKAKIYIRVPHITNRCLTLLYLIIVKSPDRESIINNSFITKNLTSLINTESTTIKSHKKHKITKELVFYPYWSSAKDVMYEFTDRFTALEHINYLFKGKLF